MRLRFWGTRGSIPAPGPSTVRYGGNTSCVEVIVSDEETLVLDGGTGLREYGASGFAHHGRVNVLITHLHMDHIQGLPFFGPLHCPACEVHVYGPACPDGSLRDLLHKYIAPPLFPEPLPKIPNVHFHEIGEEPFEIGSVKIQSRRITHRGVTLGYRLHANGICLAYMPDHEPAIAGPVADCPSEWLSGYDVALDADVLVHDGQYSAEEYPAHVGWGHSAIDDAVAFAQRCNVHRMVVFHHDPLHGDDRCDEFVEYARDLWTGPREAVLGAREGLDLDLEAWVADPSSAGA